MPIPVESSNASLAKAKSKLLRKLADKEYRDGFVAERIQTGLPFQIRALRDDRGWTQHELAEKAEMRQSRISQVEDPNYGKLSLNTLLRLASAFDVGLEVRFVAFSNLVDSAIGATPESRLKPSFAEDTDLIASRPVLSDVNSNTAVRGLAIARTKIPQQLSMIDMRGPDSRKFLHLVRNTTVAPSPMGALPSFTRHPGIEVVKSTEAGYRSTEGATARLQVIL